LLDLIEAPAGYEPVIEVRHELLTRKLDGGHGIRPDALPNDPLAQAFSVAEHEDCEFAGLRFVDVPLAERQRKVCQGQVSGETAREEPSFGGHVSQLQLGVDEAGDEIRKEI